MRWSRALASSALVIFACVPLTGQDVVAARSGLIHFSEGVVLVNEQSLQRKAEVYSSLKEGSTLRTEKGRAEVLLTPGVFLRVDENSGIQLLSNSLSHTRVAVTSGSVILDSLDGKADGAVVLVYKDSEVRFPKPGVYRIDCETGVLQTYRGEAAVTQAGKSYTVDGAHLFFFALALQTNKYSDGDMDQFYDWARSRSEVISEENEIAQQTAGDPSDLGLDPNTPLTGGTYAGAPIYTPPPTFRVPTYTYPLATGIYDPYALGISPYSPYSAFPVFVIPRPYQIRAYYPRWPHSTVFAGTRAYDPSRWPHSGTYPRSWVNTHTGIVHPAPYRPMASPYQAGGGHVPPWRPSGVGAYHPAIPSVSRPMGTAHPMGAGPAHMGGGMHVGVRGR